MPDRPDAGTAISRMMAMHLNQIALIVEDAAASVKFYELELFQYQSPSSRPFARQREPWDIGYSRIALEVNDPLACPQA